MTRLITAIMVIALLLAPGSTFAAEEEPFATGAFDPAGTLAEPRIYHTATLLPDGRVLIIGGDGASGIRGLAEAWDPAPTSRGE